MIKSRISSRVIAVGMCCFLFVWGCAQQAQQPASSVQPKEKVVKAAEPNVGPAKPATAGRPQPSEAAAKPAEGAGVKIGIFPTPGEQTTYKVTTDARRSVKWQGPVPEKSAFEEGANNEHVEMVFTQRVQGVDANGMAVSQVTIDQLKYIVTVKNKTGLDFDSTRQSDANSPLAGLIGQSYTIEVEPNNYLFSSSGLTTLMSLMNGQTAADHAGRKVLSQEAVMERHSALLLPGAGEEMLKPGGKWSKIKSFSFGMMGLKSYEKIYTLKEIVDKGGHKIAVIDTEAIPTSEVEERYRNRNVGADFPKMFDASDTYTGSGEVDLTAGRVNNYSEALEASWVTAMPENLSMPADANEPVVLRMTAGRTYKLEKIK